MNINLTKKTPGMPTLLKLGGICALLMVLIIVVQGTVSAMAPQPLDGTALDWFMLFQSNRWIGLIDFELLMVVYTILSLPIVLSLYMLHRHIHPSWAGIYVVLSIIGVVCFVIARPAFEMLRLSNAYVAATSDAQRAFYLSAGEEKLAMFHGGFFHTSYILGSLTGLLISALMLRNALFRKATSYVRIASSIFDFGLYIPSVGIYISIFSVLFLFIWNILVARRLLQLSQERSEAKPDDVRNPWVIMPDRAI